MFYRRHLPHFQKPDCALFITWRLYGSLPRKMSRARREESNPAKTFIIMDKELDAARFGPTWLSDDCVAGIVTDSLIHGDKQLELYRLSAFVVMPNHVHILIWPKKLLPRVTKSIKGYTAYECNKILKRSGRSFWQEESFDHVPRNEDEFWRIKNYIEWNPVKAGLVKRPEDWKWSSASSRWNRPSCLSQVEESTGSS